ncbi:MAG: ATP-dependent DNA helicase [Candidatus Paceibacterota bacterium]|jgi:DNA helicase-2/ATP-dependent DNA helicase PcrA
MKSQAFEENYTKLNPAQKEAVDSIDGPVMVVAGPGSGKTQILALRVANILNKTDTPSHGILCLTFTDAGAVNMLNRLKTIIGIDAYRVNIFTFHSFGTNIISRYPEYFFNQASLLPADKLVQQEVMTEIFQGLDFKNPLSSFHPENGFSFLGDSLSRISQLKKAGITPNEFDAILNHNANVLEKMNSLLNEAFGERLSVKSFSKIEALIADWEKIPVSNFPADYFGPISISCISSLKKALEDSISLNKTSPISDWKKKYTGGTNENIFLKSYNAQDKLKALASVYRLYKDELYRRGYYDYDDMILEVVQAMKNNENLRAELQEQFLYTMVDEFQDTNDAQIRLIKLLAENPVNENKPNIMIVGDDDQAIYRFQGADVSNITGFSKLYEDVKTIVMTENYRSSQDILDLARKVIVTGENRLENIVHDIDKNLVSKGFEIKPGEIKKLKFSTKEHQYHNIALRIKNLIDSGHEPKEIAVISRKHKELENIVPFMHRHKVPIVYEKQQNILATPHIHQLIQICRFLNANKGNGPSAGDNLMPEILSYPFWNISPKIIWDISLRARPKNSDTETDTPWISVMLNHEEDSVKRIAEFFVSLSARAEYEPVEYILESLIGAHVPLAPDTNGDDFIETQNEERPFVSPYKEYYFSREKLDHNKPEYLRFLSGLKFFISALRNHKSQSLLKVKDLVDFVDVHENSNVLLNDTSPFTGAENAVQLMSAHKSKGLEFGTVFLLSCQDDNWGSGGKRNNIRLPENLPIEPVGSDDDDDLRLFYVALTRAKSSLYLSTYKYKDDGKEAVEVRFLNLGDISEEEGDEDENIDTSSILETTTPNYSDPAYIENEKAFLAPLVENYILSVSHFNNFLNLVYGDGPRTFFEQNLVRFPQPMSVSNIFGTAIHRVLELALIQLKNTGILPTKNETLESFEKILSRKRISEIDLKKYLEKGKEALDVFYDEKIKDFRNTDKTEVDFKHEGVVIEDAHIGGKIDLLRVLDDEYVEVYDFKTGKPVSEKDKTERDKMKEWSFKNQIIFYQLLIENSKNYKKYKMKNGIFLFVEPVIVEGKQAIVEKRFEVTKEDIERTEKLIGIIYKKIKDLDFPNTSGYPKTQKGVEMFEEDLLCGKV